MTPEIILAPLAGYTTPGFRALCSTRGADIVYSEMVSARGLVLGSDQNRRLLERHENEKELVIQIFGDRPELMARAAKIIEKLGVADGIDINFGCPVRKVARSGSGAVLMRDPALAEKIVHAVVEAVSLPVSIKCRLGWSPQCAGAAKFVRIANEAGCSRIIIHGRWATQFYRGSADWRAVGELVAMSGIPVIVNGDIDSAEAARRALQITGAGGVAIGRAALTRPDLFAELRRALRPEEADVPPIVPDSPSRAVEVCRYLLRETAALWERWGCRGAPPHVRIRSQLMFLMKRFPGAVAARRAVLTCSDYDELDGLLSSMADEKKFILP